jgi:hypothetical protein
MAETGVVEVTLEMRATQAAVTPSGCTRGGYESAHNTLT